MAYANKATATAPAQTIYVDADRFYVQHGSLSAQVRLDGEDKVFLSYWDERSGDLRLTEDVPWSKFCVEFKAMLERLKAK